MSLTEYKATECFFLITLPAERVLSTHFPDGWRTEQRKEESAERERGERRQEVTTNSQGNKKKSERGMRRTGNSDCDEITSLAWCRV